MDIKYVWENCLFNYENNEEICVEVVLRSDHEHAIAEKDREIEELKKRVQRAPEEWESVCGECDGSGWR